MIDWITAKIPLFHMEPFHDGNVISLDREGELEWKTDKRLSVVGSHDMQLHIKYDSTTRHPETGEYSHIMFDGNPLKFLQGHNLFGSDDIAGLMSETLYKVFSILGVIPSEMDWKMITMGFYELYRVDSTMMLSLGNNADVEAFLYSAERTAHMKYKGQGQMTKGTLYFGKNSRRESLKMYNKLKEITAKGHKLPLELSELPELIKWVTGMLRIEAVTRRMQLKELNLERANCWDDDTPLITVNRLLGGLNMSEQHTLTAANLEGLPPRLISVYHMWKDGHDLKKIYLDKKTGYPTSTFKRYRKELLEHGIDIAIKQGDRSEPNPNVIEFRRVLRPELCPQVPAWAIGTPLFFEPRAKMPSYHKLFGDAA
jgi:II/X family phage/plasmid replication protein